MNSLLKLQKVPFCNYVTSRRSYKLHAEKHCHIARIKTYQNM